MSKKDPPLIPDVYVRTVEHLIVKEHALDHVVALWAASTLLRSHCCKEKAKFPLLPEIIKATKAFFAGQNPKTGEIPWRITAGAGGLSRMPLLGNVFRDTGTFDPDFPASIFLLATLVNICQAEPRFLEDDDLRERRGRAVSDITRRLDTTDTEAFGFGLPEDIGRHACGWLVPGADGWSTSTGLTGLKPYSLFNNLLVWQIFRRFAPAQCPNFRDAIFNAVCKDERHAIFTDEHPAGLALFLFTFPDAHPAIRARVQETLSQRTESFRLPLSDVMRAFYVIEAMKLLHWADTTLFMRSVRLFVARFGSVPVILHGGVSDGGFLNAAGSILISDIAAHY